MHGCLVLSVDLDLAQIWAGKCCQSVTFPAQPNVNVHGLRLPTPYWKLLAVPNLGEIYIVAMHSRCGSSPSRIFNVQLADPTTRS